MRKKITSIFLAACSLAFPASSAAALVAPFPPVLAYPVPEGRTTQAIAAQARAALCPAVELTPEAKTSSFLPLENESRLYESPQNQAEMRAEAPSLPQPIRRFLQLPGMQGASFSLLVKALDDGETIYAYDTLRYLTPASVMKTVTTAAALEILGPGYRFPTTLEYDGQLTDGVLHGNLYIKGSGDPSLGSAHLNRNAANPTAKKNDFLPEWLAAIRQAGIREIRGAVVADESIFDTEGISGKTAYEDLGSYYGAGSYGLSVFDNLYRLYLETGVPGSRPQLQKTIPEMPLLRFHNYLQARTAASDSSFILGAPFSSDRYLYGTVPANRKSYVLKGDIPDPALFLADYLTSQLARHDIPVSDEPGCYRLWKEEGKWQPRPRQPLVTTYSPPLEELVRITNHVSHNLYADALLKAIGLTCRADKNETVSSFERGIRAVRAHWEEKGLNTSSLWMYDGSGLAPAGKLTTSFLGELFRYMARQSPQAQYFMPSLPVAGQEGTVANFLKGSELQGKVRLKSGSMSQVKGYAGYIEKGGKYYVVAVLVNNYTLEGRSMNKAIENLLLALFRPL